MNLDELTLGQIKQLQGLLTGTQAGSYAHPDLGKKVIIRTYSAGVHYGTLDQKHGKEVILKDAIRLWAWDGAFTISALAMSGTSKPESCKFSVPVDSITLEMVEIIPCSAGSQKSIEGVKPHEG